MKKPLDKYPIKTGFDKIKLSISLGEGYFDKSSDGKLKKFKENNFSKIGEFNKCPYCKNKLKRLNKKNKCMYCNSLILVRTRPADSKRVMLTREEAKQIDKELDIWNKKEDGVKAEIYKKKNLKEWLRQGCTQYRWITCNKSDCRMKSIFTMKLVKSKLIVIFNLDEAFKRYPKSLKDCPVSAEEVEAIKCIKKLTIRDKKKIVDILNLASFREMAVREFVALKRMQVWKEGKQKYNELMIEMITRTELKRIREVDNLIEYAVNGFTKVKHNTRITPESGKKDIELDGKIFDIDYLLSNKSEKNNDRIPIHPNCRCWYSPSN